MVHGVDGDDLRSVRGVPEPRRGHLRLSAAPRSERPCPRAPAPPEEATNVLRTGATTGTEPVTTSIARRPATVTAMAARRLAPDRAEPTANEPMVEPVAVESTAAEP